MTIIAALRQDGHVYIGADRQWTSYYHATNEHGKLTKLGNAIIGITGIGAYKSILEYAAVQEQFKDYQFTDRNSVTLFAMEFYKWVKDNFHHGNAEADSLPDLSTTFLIGTPKKIFAMYGHLGVMEYAHYFADGCGRDYAYGSLFTSSGDPKARLKIALQAAGSMSTGCGAPYDIIEV
jgi:ATP-dependent protease HslVU (ClpYQ) peptidase subunit